MVLINKINIEKEREVNLDENIFKYTKQNNQK